MSIPRKTLDAQAMAIVVSLCLLWGMSQISIKVANRGVSPIFQAAIRSVVAAVLVALWARARGLPLLHRDRTLLHGLAIGLLFGSEFVFIYLGLSYTTASHGVIFVYTAPFFVALGAHWLLPNEPLTGRKVGGLVLAFAGVVITLWDSLGRPTPLQAVGDLMTLLLEPRPILDLQPLVIASLAYQGIIVAFASYLVWFWLIQVYPVSNLSGFTFFTPVFGVLLGGLLLHEPLTAKLLTGGGLVAGGMILVNWPESRAVHSTSSGGSAVSAPGSQLSAPVTSRSTDTRSPSVPPWHRIGS